MPQFKSGWRLQKKKHLLAGCFFFWCHSPLNRVPCAGAHGTRFTSPPISGARSRGNAEARDIRRRRIFGWHRSREIPPCRIPQGMLFFVHMEAPLFLWTGRRAPARRPVHIFAADGGSSLTDVRAEDIRRRRILGYTGATTAYFRPALTLGRNRCRISITNYRKEPPWTSGRGSAKPQNRNTTPKT